MKRRDLIRSEALSLMASVSPKSPANVRIQPVLPYRAPPKGDIGPIQEGITRTGPSGQPARCTQSLSHKGRRGRDSDENGVLLSRPWGQFGHRDSLKFCRLRVPYWSLFGLLFSFGEFASQTRSGREFFPDFRMQNALSEQRRQATSA
jgi:hypothetical protein